MARPNRYPAGAVIDAIQAAYGIKTRAAALLGCTRQTVDNYIRADPAIRAAYDQARESLVDLAEARLFALVDCDEWPAVRFILSNLGKSRGYAERPDLALLPPDPDAGLAAFQAALNRVYGRKEPP